MHNTNILKEAYLISKLLLDLKECNPDMFSKVPSKRFALIKDFVEDFEAQKEIKELTIIRNIHETFSIAYKGDKDHRLFISTFNTVFNVK